MSKVVLGIHFSAGPGNRPTADGNVAVVVDGRPAFAIAQERVTRQKYDGGFLEAAQYALKAVGISLADVDVVAISTFGRPDVAGDAEHIDVARTVRSDLGEGPQYHVVPSHHLTHALSAATQSPYERALVAVIDDEGSILGPRCDPVVWRHRMERTSYYLRAGDALTLVARDHDGPGEVGYGKAYSKVTRYVGFGSYQESGKTMALAAFGSRRAFGDLRLFRPDPDGRTRTTMRNSEDGRQDVADFFAEAGVLLPPARAAGAPLHPLHIDLAAWCQAELEESVTDRLRHLMANHGVSYVCGAGGVFLNSVMNRRLQDAQGSAGVFVPPSPGDQGMALGAACWWLWRSTGRLPRWEPQPYLGGRFDDDAIRATLASHSDVRWERCADPVSDAVRDLAAGKIVGWFQDRSEYGPRALGNRSILANPANPWSREMLNNLVKHREWFRPYAPAVAEEDATGVFELNAPVPFMMHIAPTRPEMVVRIPGGVHVDRSARLQTVTADLNPRFHRLIVRFTALAGVPAILNTSLNVDGMPIVESPADALQCLQRAPGMQALFLGSYRVTRSRGGQ